MDLRLQHSIRKGLLKASPAGQSEGRKTTYGRSSSRPTVGFFDDLP
ncbi:hypothetical protein HMPREF1556_00711 [Porphyromonas sp. oral taxon 278 str. W7784]|nr:hypothetical protein HMPREF1556_00711 [Porphyromonas sp. oral taxon 278 str. W7784]